MLQDEQQALPHIARAEIETIEQTDFLLITELNIWFVLSGYLEIMRNGADILIRTGDIFVLSKGDIVRVTGSEGNATLKIQLLIRSYQEELPAFRLNMPLSQVYKKEGYELMKQCLASLYMETVYPAGGSDYMIEGYMMRLIGLLHRYLEPVYDQDQAAAPAASDKIMEIVSYMNIHYAEKLSLDEIAAQFYISKYYLAHAFKKHLGISIGNYMKEVRLFHSSRMVEQTNEKMVTIALLNGFPNVRSFNEAFKARFKLTPAQYREDRQKESERHRSESAMSQDALALLSPYVPLGEFAPAPPVSPDRIDVQLDVRRTIGKYAKANHVLKVSDGLTEGRLLEVRQRLGVKWVAVSRILKKVGIQLREGGAVYDFKELDRLLLQIVAAGMVPYIQFHSIDYEDWLEKGLANETRFDIVFAELWHHLRQNYGTSLDWIYEFRCFYEFEHSGELCRPLADAISIFSSCQQLVIHFPMAPADAVALDQHCADGIYCIDDLTCMRKIPFDAAMEHLLDTAYPRMIGEQANRKMQHQILDQLLVYEQDDDLSAYSDLIQANASIWHYINFMNFGLAAGHYYPPLSLDSAKLFEYFPQELADKLSLCTSDGRYKDNWYATEFVSRLYDEVVFHNEACIVTKRQDDYRILTIYPEQEMLIYLKYVNKEALESVWHKAKSPYLPVKLELAPLDGSYRVVKQQLTPVQSEERKSLAQLRACKKLSFDDIAYWNGVNRPSRSVETLNIKGNYTIDLEIPLFGITMIDIEKSNNLS